MEFNKVVESRRSVKSFDPTRTISDEELKDLFAEVILTPSSFNLQHWRFIVVRDQAIKDQLREAAWNQEQVSQASAVVLVCGKINAHQDAQRIFAETSESIRERVLPLIDSFYGNHPERCHDEAIRSASMAAMTLMLVAQDRGYSTCPMIGYDPMRVVEILSVPEDHLPVMMVVIGYAAKEPRTRSSRYSIADVVSLETFDGKRLV